MQFQCDQLSLAELSFGGCVTISLKYPFHINTFALNVTLKQRLGATRKWLITRPCSPITRPYSQ